MRAGRRRDTWVSLVSSTCLHLLKCSSLLVRPAHMVSFTGCLCHLLLLLPRPSSIPPHSQGDDSAIHAPRGAQLHEPQDQLPPSSNLCSSHHRWPLGHVDPVDCKVEEGRTPKQCIPAFPRGEQGSSHFIPAAPSRSRSPCWASLEAHHGPTHLTIPIKLLCCCFLTTYLFIQ